MERIKLIGQQRIKESLQQMLKAKRIPHAQIFSGIKGCGHLPFAISFAQSVLNQSSELPFIVDTAILEHPDLHFVFPVSTNKEIKKNPLSSMFLSQWRTFLQKSPYGGLYDWYQFIEIENKQGVIGSLEAVEMTKTLALKSFKGGFKVMIIWMPEKLNHVASNKILKLIEEPTDKTCFILVTEDLNAILPTIKSRCQVTQFPNLTPNDLTSFLVNEHQLVLSKAEQIAFESQNDLGKALTLLTNDGLTQDFEKRFIVWVRSAFKAKGNPSVIQDLINWSESLSTLSREVQKQFLLYSLSFFRQAFLFQYKVDRLIYLSPKDPSFKFESFSKFVHSNNILQIVDQIEHALKAVQRNGNSKMVFLNLSIKLTRLIHV